MLRSHLYFHVVFVSLLSSAPEALGNPGAIPEDAQKALDALPGKALSLPFMVSRAFEVSTSAQEIKSQAPLLAVPELSARAATDTTLKAQVARIQDEKEGTSPFNPTRTEAKSGTLGVETFFSSGTLLKAEYGLTQAETQLSLNNIPQTDSLYESQLNLSVAQNLLKDSFGKSTRAALRSGAIESRAATASLESAFEEWFLQISQSYYTAWLSQEQLLAADQSLVRRQKLLNITQIRARRGTAEEPELLQIRTAVTQAALSQEEAAQGLQEQWRFLVISLGLPSHWADIDARRIPLKFEAPFDQALQKCGGKTPAPPSQVVAAQLQSEAATLKQDRARNLALPELQLFASASYNGVDSEGGRATSQNFSLDHPAYNIGLRFSMPLGGRLEEAQVRSAIADQMRARARAAAAADQHVIQWANECANLKRLMNANIQLKASLASQLERVRLEENRFQVGRVPLINVIQAGDDSTQARVALSANEMSRAMSAWRILRSDGTLKTQLEQLKGQSR
jgi:outer membrane protein TolC